MGRVWRIGFLALAFLVACNNNKQVPELVEGPSVELSAIDSLLWRQPDSALAVLQDYLACRDAMIASPEIPDGDFIETHAMRLYDRHYANLLLAELLYKNDYAQTNRMELLQAVGYFDSLTFTLNDHSSPRRLIAGGDPLSPTRNDQLFFLSARAHYINGVGYYEHDSVVPACKEYLKALEVMEEHFEEEELTANKSDFEIKTYYRLSEVFSSRFMIDPTIECYRKALSLSKKTSLSSYSISNVLFHLGVQFGMANQIDSALYYYNQSLTFLSDTNNSLYRDILSNRALLVYQLQGDNNFDKAMQDLKQAYKTAQNKDEKLQRLLAFGWMHYEKGLTDSAIYYLDKVYNNSKKTTSKVQAAEYLQVLYKKQGQIDKANDCANFLSQYALSGFEQQPILSELSELFLNYQQQVKYKHMYNVLEIRTIWKLFIIILLLVGGSFIITKTRQKKLIKEKEDLLRTQEIHHKAIEKHLKKANKQLLAEKELLNERYEEHTKVLKQSKASAIEYDALLNEAICYDLLHRFGKTEILTTNKSNFYSKFAITAKEKRMLANAVEKHCPNFGQILLSQYHDMKSTDFEMCRFLLIGLSEPQIAVLLQKDYSTIWRRAKRIKDYIKTAEPKHQLKHILFEDVSA